MLSEPVEERKKVAITLGADLTVNPLEESLRDVFIKETGTEGADVVIECAGVKSSVVQSFDVARKGASIVLLVYLKLKLPMKFLYLIYIVKN